GGGGDRGRPAADNKIVITYAVGSEEELKEASATIDVSGSTAKLRIHGPHNNFHAVIELPARSDLYIRLAAGLLQLEGIRGNKDIESHAGNLELDIGSAQDYQRVDASVYSVNLDASAFGVHKGGLFRSFGSS